MWRACFCDRQRGALTFRVLLLVAIPMRPLSSFFGNIPFLGLCLTALLTACADDAASDVDDSAASSGTTSNSPTSLAAGATTSSPAATPTGSSMATQSPGPGEVTEVDAPASASTSDTAAPEETSSPPPATTPEEPGPPSPTSMGGGGSAGATQGAGGAESAAGGNGGASPSTDGSAMGGASDAPAAGGNGNVEPEPTRDPDLIGWASVPECGPNGTTGGGFGEPTLTVTTLQELREALTTEGPLVFAVSGAIDSPGGIGGVSDKTLLGVNGAEIRGRFGLSGARNVIIKDIVFRDGDDDTFELSGGECVWLDHCVFRDGLDGNLDIVRASNFVTVSWSRFYYTRGHDHMLSNLCGNGQPVPEDEGKINITFHHNWWGAGVKERKPRVRYGQVHVFNNYYRYEPVPGDSGDSYQVAAGYMSKLLVENNYFDGSNSPIRWMDDENTAQVVERGNEFVGTSGDIVTRGASFDPPYDYTMDLGSQVKDLVLAGAGPR